MQGLVFVKTASKHVLPFQEMLGLVFVKTASKHGLPFQDIHEQ
jgi:predicted DNA binding CopG/RHH family protein